MRLKNTAKGGRGFGAAGTHFEWEPGQVKEVDDAIVAEAKKDPTNAALFGEGGDLVDVGGNPNARPGSPALRNPSGSHEDIAKIEAAAAAARAEEEARVKAASDAKVAEDAAAVAKAAADAEAAAKTAAEASKVEADKPAKAEAKAKGAPAK